MASMEPGHEDREYVREEERGVGLPYASMEPGHEDREYCWAVCRERRISGTPQWSPVMKTGNTQCWASALVRGQ